ncbi:hypothetical protein ABZX93_31630 [Streptomyces sp. NPDC006632]|uniref:hypothetical protein n=1 Tax=Streptomyces sp. NPDC006632 TaxID=3157182 RepID=UPI0033A3CF6D
MSDDVIEPGGIPMFTGDLEQLTKDAAALTKQAGAFRDGGADVHKEFQGLSACYQAPEADQLFATTLPVKTKADDFADDLEKAAAALTEYEGVVRPLVKKLQSLRTEAFAFTDSIAGDDHWRRDQSKIDHNTRLVQDVGATVTAFTDAERACHDKITALVGGSKLTVDDGSHKPGMYGYSADMMKHAEETPWGGYAEREYTGVRWLWEQTKSFVWDGFIVDGVWGTIKGLGTLVGTDGWDKAGQAWTGLAKLATGLVITATPLGGLFWAVPDKQLPSWLRDSRTAMKETGKALVAWDEWGKNPARAAGGVTFNVLTTVFTGGAGSAAKGGAVAKVLSVTGKVAKVVDPMTYVAKAGKFGVIKVGDLFGSLKNVYSGRYADVLAGGGKYDLDGTYVKNPDVPVIKGNYVEWSSGSRLDLDEGTVYRPDGTVAPAKVELSADDIALLKSELPHVDATVPGSVKQPVLVGAGDRAGHVGDHPATPGTRTPGGTAGHTPGGAAHDLGRGAANDLDRGATGGSRGGAPSAGDTAGHAADTGAHSGTSSAGHGTGGHGTGGHDGGSGGHEPGHGGGAGDDAGHVPGGHDGTGGAGHDGEPPSGRRTTEQELEIKRQQVERANNDPAWFEKHYRVNGYRRYITDGGYGQELPQLSKDPAHPGKWVATDDLPPAIREDYIHPEPIPGHRADVSGDVLKHLDDQASKRHNAIVADRAAEDQLKAAEKAYEAHQTPELADAMAQADAHHSPLHGQMTKQSELFGEEAAEHHAIPEHYAGAKRVDDGAFGNNRFDQVYETKDGRYVVVEAKGSTTASLGTRKGLTGRRVTQGTREYFETILAEMEKRASKANGSPAGKAEAALMTKLDTALREGRVDYVLVKADSDGAKYAGYEMKQFDLSIRK